MYDCYEKYFLFKICWIWFMQIKKPSLNLVTSLNILHRSYENYKFDTNKISKVHLRDELWIVSDGRYTIFVVKGHQKETKVDLENQLRKKKL